MSTAPDTPPLYRPTAAWIDLDAFDRNIDAVSALLPKASRLIPILKANGYGHGAVRLAERCAAKQVYAIAVALLEEALELRAAGIGIPIMILGPLRAEQMRVAAKHELIVAIVGPEQLLELAAAGTPVRAHLKLDSGMGRMGVLESELDQVIAFFKRKPPVTLEAIYTHFANASNPDDPFTGEQIACFDRMVATLRSNGVEAPLHHLANSPATLTGLVRPGDLVRVGISLYGGEPLDAGKSRFEPVMRWTTRIARLKKLPAGHAVGYGTTYRTKIPSLIATLPVGYTDGYNRLLSNQGEVLVLGQRAPVVGRVSMDLLTIDVTGVKDVAVGDEVVLLGRSGSDEIRVEEIAQKIGTISYEVFCGVSARVPRIYLSGGSSTIESKFDVVVRQA